jgi:hypothetical protein
MRTWIIALLIFAISGTFCAAQTPNSPAGGPLLRPGHENMARNHGDFRERLAQRHEEYIKWLEKNYPDEAKELAQLKQENPDRYLERLNESFEKYGRLARADKNNPELAKLIRQDIELKAQIEQKLEQIRQSANDKEKQKFTDELQQLISKRFDNIVAQKQIRYQELNKRLENLKKEITKQEFELEKLKGKKNEEVKKRVDELVNEKDQIHWD